MCRVHGLELDRQRAEVAQLDDRRTRAVVREQAVGAAERAVRDAHVVQVAHAGGGAAREARAQRERERRACVEVRRHILFDEVLHSCIEACLHHLRTSERIDCLRRSERVTVDGERDKTAPCRARPAARERVRGGTRPRSRCRRRCVRRHCGRRRATAARRHTGRPTPSSAG